MKKMWKRWVAGLAVMAGTASGALAQAPVAPAPAVGVGGAPVAAAPAPANLFSFLCPTPEQKAACKQKICNSALGQMLNNSLKPVSAMTGGVIPTFCPTISAADLAKPADTPGGAAARVKADEADAKKRIDDIRVLAGADCSRWPEAQDALINALRLDRNECVRVEAALAFGRGCCCTKPVIKALALTVSGGTEDGAPVERSPRVRSAAQMSLDHCLACFVEVEPAPPAEPDRKKELVPPPKPEVPGAPVDTKTMPPAASYYQRINTLPGQQVVGDARRVLTRVTPTAAAVTPAVYQAPADRSITGLVESAWHSEPAQPQVAQAPLPATLPTVVTQPMPMPERPSVIGLLQKNFHSEPEQPKVVAQPTMVPQPLVVSQPTTVPQPPVVTTPLVIQTMPERPSIVGLIQEKRSSEPSQPTVATQPTAPMPALKPLLPATPAPALESSQTALPPPVPVSSAKPTGAVTQVVALEPAKPVAPELPPGVEVIDTTRSSGRPLPPPAPVPPTSARPSDTAKLVCVLSTSPSAELREMAAHTLAALDRSADPEVARGLINAARGDTAPNVRAASIRALARMNNRTAPVLAVVQTLKNDADPLVRYEAERAYRILTQTETTPASTRLSLK